MNPPIDTQHLPLWPQHPDTHYSHLATTLPPWLLTASASRRTALAATPPDLVDRFKDLTFEQHRVLKRQNGTYWKAQNAIDQHLERLQDAHSFGEPLLRDALKQQYGLDLDVRTTWLRLYIPASIPWFPIKSGAARTWTVSLLDAALHNFEPAETENDAYEADSTYITQPTAAGRFEVLDNLKDRLGIADFARLCRELDLGGKYQLMLSENLGVSDPMVNAVLQPQIKASHQASLHMALELAVVSREPLSPDTYRSIRGLVDGMPGMLLAGKPLLCHELTMMSAPLTGILLFAPDLERNRDTVPVIAYIPDDPQQPLKEYPSGAHLMADLSRKLRDTEYQTFFSRFVAHADRGYFFSDLNQRLTHTTWHQRAYGDARPSWRADAAAHTNLQFAARPITSDVWTHLHQSKLDKILNDARTLAVSTASADRNARWERWYSFTKIASTLLQIAAFVALPFVPFLGELMLAYTAYQVLDETFESIVDWAQGLTQQAFAHTMGVIESLVQLGAFAAGGSIAVAEFRQALPREWVDFIDRFIPVKSTDGRTRYWNGDLTPYEQPDALPESQPDARGLQQHGDRMILALEGKRYSVAQGEERPGYRIEHPRRPEAYKPRLNHNGQGSWQTELDQPLTWSRDKVMQRLGRIADTLSASDRETALKVSGYHENAVRKLHVDLEPLPSLLADTLTRFKIDRELDTFIARLASDDPATYLAADGPTQLQLLTERLPWPEQKGLRLIDGRGDVVWQSSYQDGPSSTIHDIRPGGGDVLKAALEGLSEADIKALAEERFGAPALSLDARATQLRVKLAQIAQQQRSALFDARYRAQQRDIDPLAQHLVDAVPGLPGGAAEELLLSASATEWQQLEQGVVAPRLRELAGWTLQNVRAVRAREGLDLDSCDNPDTHRLALHSLTRLPGWSGEVRIDVTRYSVEGDVIDNTGLATAPARKVLVQLEEGLYQAYDDSGQQLSGAEDFYNCVLKALPDNERQRIQLQIGQGPALKQAIARHSPAHDEVQRLLASHPLLKPAYDPRLMRLPGGTDGYPYRHPGAPSLNSRVRDLYPSLSPEQIADFARTLQQHPSGARIELSRLFAEFTQLDADLRTWAQTEVHHHPFTGAPLTPAQLAAAADNRAMLADQLRLCWRRQTPITDPAAQGGDPDYLFQFTRPLIGEFPRLTADFSHITYVILEGNENTLGARAFLNTFTGVRQLAVRNIALPTLPEVVATRPNLNQLIISNCMLRLTPESQSVIASLHQLHTLDLYRNPLGMGVSLEAMPDLEYLDLGGCGLTSTPEGLATRTKLRTAIFTDNLIGHLPVELFDLPPSRVNNFEFDNNPLSVATRNRIKASYQSSGQDYGVSAPQADLERAVLLYPRLDREEASAFVYRLPGTLESGRRELTRLEDEYRTLVDTLANWTADVPAVHPASGAPFTPEELLAEHSIRDDFKREMEKAWRKEIDRDGFEEDSDPDAASYELVLDMPVTGGLPALEADFGHVSHLYMSNENGLSHVGSEFLRGFAKLNALTINNYRLATIPDAVLTMGQMRSLVLTNCHLTLTPETVAGLAGMDKMDILDLSQNPLMLAPDVSQMSALSTLILNDTQLTELPNGMLGLRSLDDANLSHNQIQNLPSDLLELPMEIAESINLRGNPFTGQSVQLLHAYFRRTGVDFGVESIINEAELEVSESDDSTPED